jgi:hypothetical protein
MGIIDVGTLTRGRRYVLLGLFIAAALLTPPVSSRPQEEPGCSGLSREAAEKLPGIP